jgi:uncharacterized protein (UPF0333 family)
MGDREERAQASIEFLLIVGIATMVLIPAMYFFFIYSEKSQETTRINQIEKLGTDIINKAETVYYYSDPSKMELVETMPDNVKGIGIVNDWGNNINLLIINYSSRGKIQPIVFLSRVNINGSFEARDFTVGRKVISIEAKRYNQYIYSNIDFK